jgi:hypothetical protein
VLKRQRNCRRIDLTKSLQKLAGGGEVDSFAYGSLLDNFLLMVSTIKYKQDSQIDLKKSLNGIQALESQKTQNMIVKQEVLKLRNNRNKDCRTFTRLNNESKAAKSIMR